jgi:hypothetical protein
VGDLAQLGDRGAQFGDRGVEQGADVGGAVVQVPLSQAQPHAQGDQALLGAVVQVPFQAAAFGVRDGQQAAPAGLGVAQRAGQLDPQPHHLHQQRGRRRHLPQQHP